MQRTDGRLARTVVSHCSKMSALPSGGADDITSTRSSGQREWRPRSGRSVEGGAAATLDRRDTLAVSEVDLNLDVPRPGRFAVPGRLRPGCSPWSGRERNDECRNGTGDGKNGTDDCVKTVRN